MKMLTLTEYIQEKLDTDPEFAKLYARQRVINDISHMLVEARKRARMTQAELAERIGGAQPLIARIESGQSAHMPSLETLMRIAQALNVSLRLHFD